MGTSLANSLATRLGFRLGANVSAWLAYFRTYLARVEADSGTVESNSITTDIFKFYEQQGLTDNIQLLYNASAGLKVREDGVLKYVPKIYDLSQQETPADGTQTTEASQPRLKGIIPPNEKPALSNQNGETRYLTHPEISFAADEAWSVTVVVNNYKTQSYTAYSSQEICGKNNAGALRIMTDGLVDYFQFANNDGAGATGVNSNSNLIGKSTHICFIAEGNGSLKIYINGSLFETLTVATNFNIDRLLQGRNSTSYFRGSISHHSIQSGALTPTQVAAEYNMLRALYPEIPSVQIGTQTWATSNFEAVATPIGNVIQEMQSAANVDVNAGWDLTNWSTTGTCTIDDSDSFTVTNSGGILKGILPLDSWIKLTLVGVSSTAVLTITFWDGVNVFGNIVISGGVIDTDIYFKTLNRTSLYVTINETSTIDLTTFECEEVGWAGSQDLFDGLIAQGESVQTALEAAAMWCYYNNDVDLGATYGKLYNWFAAKLLQTDIESYNTANPSNTWGYHVPTSTEFTTLQTYLGGSTVAGGKMKVAGTDYWLTPNTGADNSSGFSAMGGGYRTIVIFTGITTRGIFWTETSVSSTNADRVYMKNDDGVLYSPNDVKINGFSLRLIKD